MSQLLIRIIGIFFALAAMAAPFNLELLQTSRLKGQYYDLAISQETAGDRLYVAAKIGVEIYSLDNPAHPVLIGMFITSGLANGVAVNHPFVYVGDVYGFGVWDLSDIDHPVLRSEYRSDEAFGYQERLYYRDGKVFIAAYTSGIQVIDVSDPDRPVLVGSTRTGAYAWDMALSDDAAYIMDFFSMAIVDIRRPDYPVNRVKVNAMFSSGAAVRDDLLYLGYVDGLRVMDISDPFNPVDVSDIGPTGSGTAETVSLSGQYAFVGHGGYIEIYDISIPANPIQVSYFYPPGHPRKLVAHNGYLYTVLDDSGFVVTDVRDPNLPVQTVHVNGGEWGTRKDVVTDENYLYLVDWNRGLVIFDASDPAALIELSNYLVPGALRDCVIEADTAYLVCQSEIQIVDITDRTNPLFVGKFQTSGSPNHVSIDSAQDRIYLCDLYGFYILDISDPADIRRMGAVWLAKEGNPYASRIIGHHAFIANGWKGMKVIDIADPSSPNLVNVWPGDNSKSYVDVQLRNGMLHFLDPYNGIEIVDVTDPLSPELHAVISPDDVIINDFRMLEDLLFIAAGSSGIFVYDIESDSDPVMVARSDTPGEAIGIEATSEAVFVADRYDLSVFRRKTFAADSSAPDVSILTPAALSRMDTKTVSVSGIGADEGSGIRKVEISVDGGATWSQVFGQEIWSGLVSGHAPGPLGVRARATDWSGLTGPETADIWFYFNPPVPQILLAGYGNTRVTAGQSSSITMNALVRDPWDEVFIDEAKLYLNGQPTDSVFTAQPAGSGYKWLQLTFDQTFNQGGRPDFSIVVTDIYGNPSVTWPYVPVRW